MHSRSYLMVDDVLLHTFQSVNLWFKDSSQIDVVIVFLIQSRSRSPNSSTVSNCFSKRSCFWSIHILASRTGWILSWQYFSCLLSLETIGYGTYGKVYKNFQKGQYDHENEISCTECKRPWRSQNDVAVSAMLEQYVKNLALWKSKSDFYLTGTFIVYFLQSNVERFLGLWSNLVRHGNSSVCFLFQDLYPLRWLESWLIISTKMDVLEDEMRFQDSISNCFNVLVHVSEAFTFWRPRQDKS